MRYIICVLILLIIAISCRKRTAMEWESNWVAPVAHGTLSLNKLVMDSVLRENPDSSLILDYEQTIVELNLNDLIQIPDTAIKETFTIPSPLQNLSIIPGQNFFDEPRDFEYDGISVSLSKLIIKNGVLQYSINSPVNRKTIITYSIPGATKNNVSFIAEIPVPAAPTNGTASKTGTLDLTGYTFDLRGVSGTLYNTLETNFTVALAPGETGTTLHNSDTIILETSFKSIEPQYVKGYFGQQTFQEKSSGIQSDLLSFYGGGYIDIEFLKVKFFLENSIGIDSRVNINFLRGINTFNSSFIDLNHAVINQTINLNRALDLPYSTIQTYPYRRTFNTLNSNIEDFFETLPQKLAYDVDIEINPLGNVSNATDFAFCDGGIKAALQIQMPLSFFATDLVIQDTIDMAIDINESLDINELKLTVEVDNFFPFSAEPILYILDETTVVTDTLFGGIITSATLGSSGISLVSVSENELVYTLDKDQANRLRENGKLIFKARINTPSASNHIKIKSHYYMDVRIFAEANLITRL